MRYRLLSSLTLLAIICASIPTMISPSVVAAIPSDATPAAVPAAPPTIRLDPIGAYKSDSFDEGGAEIVAHDPSSQRIFIVNGATKQIDVVSIANPGTPVLSTTIVLSPTYGSAATSVDVYDGVLAVAVQAAVPTDPGKVVFFDNNGVFLKEVPAGVLPDMVTFSPDGSRVLAANEAQPSDDYTIDPEGSVTIIDLDDGVANATAVNVGFAAFNEGQPRHAELPADVRIFGPNASVAQDLEPEYIAVSPDGTTAYVTLQENNALAIIDIASASITAIKSLGFKDYSLPGNGIDASDRDGPSINIARWPVKGMYQPDGIAAYQSAGQTFLVTANEGDARAYDGFDEETRVGSEDLDTARFTDTTALKNNAQLGRLRITNATGQKELDGDDEFEELYAFGARSFSIWNGTSGALVFDSGDDLEQRTAAAFPQDFNSTNSENQSFDTRSDDKGPEPEGVTLGTLGGRTYAFLGLERIGGVMVYDVTNPVSPTFVLYENNRDFSGDAEAGTAGDLGPEGLIFIPADQSPNGKPLVIVGNEVSASTTIYEISAADRDGAGTLTLLHNNDGESSLLPINNTVISGATSLQLPTAGISAFKSVTLNNIAAARNAGNAVVNVYAGDAFLASATLACSLPANATTPVFDAIAQRQISYDAQIIGNHEFDYTPDFLERFIRAFEVDGKLTQPFLSSNLNFQNEPRFADLLDADGLIDRLVTDGRVLARSMVVTDTATTQRFGLVGATTPELPTISSPRNVTVTPTMTETAVAVQGEIDRLQTLGIQKILFISHLQDVGNDRQIVKMLHGVDIAVAGGGDELLASTTVPTTTQLLPGELAPIAGSYPLVEKDADGRDVYIVTTAGNYKYLGRIDVEFDDAGEIVAVNRETSYPRRVIPTSAVSTQLQVPDAVAKDAQMVTTVEQPVQDCLQQFAATPVVRSEVVLDVSRTGVRGRETNVGNLIADAFVASYDRYAQTNGLPARSATHPVIGIQNGGGIRQNAGDALPAGGAPGTISRLDTLNILSFDNTMAVVKDIPPADLKTIFERSASSLPGAGGQFLQVSGIRVVYNQLQPVNSRVRSLMLEDGTAIVSSGAVVAGAPSVSIVTNNFTAGGGDNYPTLANNPNKTIIRDNTGAFLGYEQAWREYLTSLPQVQGLPTIQASDLRYRPGGEGRILVFTRNIFLPVLSANE